MVGNNVAELLGKMKTLENDNRKLFKMCEDHGDKIKNLENENVRLIKINENQGDKIVLLKDNLTHLQQ